MRGAPRAVEGPVSGVPVLPRLPSTQKPWKVQTADRFLKQQCIAPGEAIKALTPAVPESRGKICMRLLCVEWVAVIHPTHRTLEADTVPRIPAVRIWAVEAERGEKTG